MAYAVALLLRACLLAALSISTARAQPGTPAQPTQLPMPLLSTGQSAATSPVSSGFSNFNDRSYGYWFSVPHDIMLRSAAVPYVTPLASTSHTVEIVELLREPEPRSIISSSDYVPLCRRQGPVSQPPAGTRWLSVNLRLTAGTIIGVFGFLHATVVSGPVAPMYHFPSQAGTFNTTLEGVTVRINPMVTFTNLAYYTIATALPPIQMLNEGNWTTIVNLQFYYLPTLFSGVGMVRTSDDPSPLVIGGRGFSNTKAVMSVNFTNSGGGQVVCPVANTTFSQITCRLDNVLLMPGDISAQVKAWNETTTWEQIITIAATSTATTSSGTTSTSTGTTSTGTTSTGTTPTGTMSTGTTSTGTTSSGTTSSGTTSTGTTSTGTASTGTTSPGTTSTGTSSTGTTSSARTSIGTTGAATTSAIARQPHGSICRETNAFVVSDDNGTEIFAACGGTARCVCSGPSLLAGGAAVGVDGTRVLTAWHIAVPVGPFTPAANVTGVKTISFNWPRPVPAPRALVLLASVQSRTATVGVLQVSLSSISSTGAKINIIRLDRLGAGWEDDGTLMSVVQALETQ